MLRSRPLPRFLLALLTVLLLGLRMEAATVDFDATSADWTNTPFGNWKLGTSTWTFDSMPSATANSHPTLTFQVIVSQTSVTWSGKSVAAIRIDDNFGTGGFNIYILAKGTDGAIYQIGSNEEDDLGAKLSPQPSTPVIFNTNPRLLCPASVTVGQQFTDVLGKQGTIQATGVFSRGGLPGGIRIQFTQGVDSWADTFVPGLGWVEESETASFRARLPDPTFDSTSADLSDSFLKGWTMGATIGITTDVNAGGRHEDTEIHTANVESLLWNGQNVQVIKITDNNQRDVFHTWIAKGSDKSIYVLKIEEPSNGVTEFIPARLEVPATPVVGQTWTAPNVGSVDIATVEAINATSTIGSYTGAVKISNQHVNSSGVTDGTGFNFWVPGIGAVEWDEADVPSTLHHHRGGVLGSYDFMAPEFGTGIFWFPDAQGRWAITNKDGVQTNDDTGFVAILPSGHYLHYQASDVNGGNGPEFGVWHRQAGGGIRFSSVDDDNGDVGPADPGRNLGVTDLRLLAAGGGRLAIFNTGDSTPENVLTAVPNHVPTANAPFLTGFWATANGVGLEEVGSKGVVFFPDQHYIFLERVNSSGANGTYLVDYGTFTIAPTAQSTAFVLSFTKHGGNALNGPTDGGSDTLTFAKTSLVPVDYGVTVDSFTVNGEIFRDVIGGLHRNLSLTSTPEILTDITQAVRVVEGQTFDVPILSGDTGVRVPALFQGTVVAGQDVNPVGVVAINAVGNMVVRFTTIANPAVQGEKGARLQLMPPAGVVLDRNRYRVVITDAQSGSVAAPTILFSGKLEGLLGERMSSFIQATNTTAFAATGLPSGLNIDSATGQVFGRPTVSGQFTAAITATGPGGTATQAVDVVIGQAMRVNIYHGMLVEGETGLVEVELSRVAPPGGITFQVKVESVLDWSGLPDLPSLSPSDVVFSQSTVTIPEGKFLATIEVQAVDDGIAEGTEIGQIALVAQNGAEVLGFHGYLTVYDPQAGANSAEFLDASQVRHPLADASITLSLGESLPLVLVGRSWQVGITQVTGTTAVAAGPVPRPQVRLARETASISSSFREEFYRLFFSDAGTYQIHATAGVQGVDLQVIDFTVNVEAGSYPLVDAADLTVPSSTPDRPQFLMAGGITDEAYTFLETLRANLSPSVQDDLGLFRWDPSLQAWVDGKNSSASLRRGEPLALAINAGISQGFPVIQSGTARPFTVDVVDTLPGWNLVSLPATGLSGATSPKLAYDGSEFAEITPSGWLIRGDSLGFPVNGNIPKRGFSAGESYWVYNGCRTTVPIFLMPPADGPGVASNRSASTRSAARMTMSGRGAATPFDHTIDAPALPGGVAPTAAPAAGADNAGGGGCGGGAAIVLVLGSLLFTLRRAGSVRRAA